MDFKLMTITVTIIFLNNVKVNSYHFLNRISSLGIRPITTALRPVTKYLCSKNMYHNRINDILMNPLLLQNNQNRYQEPQERHYYLKNGLQPVPTRRFIGHSAKANEIFGNLNLENHNNRNTIANSKKPMPITVGPKNPEFPLKHTLDNISRTKPLKQIDQSDSFNDTNTVINVSETNKNVLKSVNEKSFYNYIHALERFERMFYMATFNKLTAIAPENRSENGMSFVQSGLFLQLILTALSSEVDESTRNEIENVLKLNSSNMNTTHVIKEIVSSLPQSDNDVKFRWTSRLVLSKDRHLSQEFKEGPAAALQLHTDNFNGTETPSDIAKMLNNMIENDSGGAIRDTFDEDDFTDNVEAVLITTLYLRAQWRSAPTLLNGTHDFLDSEIGPYRTVRMIRINDIMKYAKLEEWKAEAIEIFYKRTGLSLFILASEENSIQNLTRHVSDTSIRDIIAKMKSTRVAATLPLYTLRMTLLLPNKLQAMGIHNLVDKTNSTERETLRITHAVQRLMFWAEAGRNAYKDDGIEWDEHPEIEVLINRPYIFYVRWKNMTLMNGNFVL